jgi:predicted ATP-dependent endonuclease of OLD family
VPDEIPFSDDYKSTGKLAYSKNREWQEIVEEIFKRAEAEGIDNSANPLQYFFGLTNTDKRDDILSDIQDVLNKEIIEEWKKIKRSGLTNFADDSENLSLELKCPAQSFTFKVKDKSNQDKKRTFNVSERSKGFQWFFNYMIKLKFNPRYKGKQENSIFLLDEPGSYLHSSAQIELLNELKTVSKKNTIIYCTHSQYLLNPKIIKLGSIKIAQKEKSNITLTAYGNYKGKDDKGALSAVYQALHLNFTQDFVGKIVITEGITDLYFFLMLRQHTNFISNEIRVIPGAGSGNSSNLISIGISFSENFVVLFDNDRGAKAMRKYMGEFGEEICKHFHLYSEVDGFTLEDFLSKSEKQKLCDLTNTTDLKKALTALYYDQPEDQKSFFSNLESGTLSRLAPTLGRINNL